MAKRFTDTEKWKKQFIKGLSTVHKLFFLYLLDDCDHAGIWHVEHDVAQLRIGEQFDLDEVRKILNKHIVEFDNCEKWFIPYFIEFQYGTLNGNVNAHKSVIDKLKKYNLYEQFIKSSSSLMDKDKDKDIDKDKRKVFVKPTPEEIQAYLNEVKCTYFTGKYFFDKNEAIGWLVGKNKTPMKDWKATVRTWINNGNDKQNKETPVKKPSDNYNNGQIERMKQS